MLFICLYPLMEWVIPEKNQKTGEVEDVLFWKNPWTFLVFYFTPGNSGQNKDLPQETPQIWLHPSKILRPKTKTPLEIPHYYFLISPGNFTLFLVNIWKSNLLFPQYLWKSYPSTPLFLFLGNIPSLRPFVLMFVLLCCYNT